MQTIEIGSINIQNQEVIDFVKNKNHFELKSIIVDLLQKEAQKEAHNKWSRFADKIAHESLLSGKSQQVASHAQSFRENFQH
ncbi:MAG: hypothetical protein JXQ76_02280 [Campylobacterales bacterium]|nr:hypothetical protein [Campylobacterales bacterium]